MGVVSKSAPLHLKVLFSATVYDDMHFAWNVFIVHVISASLSGTLMYLSLAGCIKDWNGLEIKYRTENKQQPQAKS